MRISSLRGITRAETPGEALIGIGAAVVLVGLPLFTCYQCFWETQDTKLQRGHNAFAEMTQETKLEDAGFYDAYPEGTPSEFVEFVDTIDARGPDATGAEQWQIAFDALSPEDLVYSPRKPDPDQSRQLVYIPDDDSHRMILEGYLDPDDEPLHEWTVDFPSDAGEPDS